MTAPKMTIVVALGENGVIGRDGDMPWQLPSDLRRFKAITLGKPVVMGRRTLESIGRPLPGRDNLIVSRDPDYRPDGVTVFADLDAAVAAARRIATDKGLDEFVVGGGGTLYAALIGRADRLRVTRVAASPDGDTRFPAIDPADWDLVHEEPMPRGERDSTDALWQDYERRAPKAADR
ncbi:dihydrofolate reductase [Oharaeibacter diazotrophicus]|uniref:Dihydrofolate reductase n=1 Tax=Oharaeibacter diazotrophicus TaxID=1920512 RepID=A0A4R6RH32_9HYPH|nr:dihydrofolate reductase [Oharaeibacter diazotrophicus]TDP85574.1 dihydrofolate reductase [Oharaeibacter diazotrophicus]BBE74545.1 dihydrofolate reductase type 3 [Pleomorphomonas sp. SM30]GLS75756.1 dihydrofolate reductase [Oharaeibacter diazotrophicus]